jgi:hypothetical protein
MEMRNIGYNIAIVKASVQNANFNDPLWGEGMLLCSKKLCGLEVVILALMLMLVTPVLVAHLPREQLFLRHQRIIGMRLMLLPHLESCRSSLRRLTNFPLHRLPNHQPHRFRHRPPAILSAIQQTTLR